MAAEILEVRGNTAYPGKAKGYAKIIYNEEMFQKFKEGDILITPMTAANYTSLIDKAAAIITDEGGITCHAAIVARELGIPAVVGTENATRIIKTGDPITVDTTGSAGNIYRGFLKFKVVEHDLKKIPHPNSHRLRNLGSVRRGNF